MDKSVVKNQLVEMIKQVYHKAILMEQDVSLTQPTVDALLNDIEKLYKQAVMLSYWSPVEIKKDTAEVPTSPKIVEAAPVVQSVTPIVPAETTPSSVTPVVSHLTTTEIENVQEQVPPLIPNQVEIPIVVNEPVYSPSTAKPTLKPGKKPIADLSNALSLNERFQLNNQLFKGNMVEMNEALKMLNSRNNYQDANAVFLQLKERYQWKEENAAFQLLEDLVIRRYA
jgi:hypothetical protein